MMMMKHMSTAHIDEKPYECDKCSEKFYDNDTHDNACWQDLLSM